MSTPRRQLQALGRAILIGFLLVILTLLLWSVLQAPTMRAREDNPRRVETALRVQRGAILDREGRVLARTAGSGNDLRRVYPLPAIGPAVGYYNFRFGTAGVEEGYDAVLRGANAATLDQARRDLLNRPQEGRSIQLTLSARWQLAASALMGEEKGALVLIRLPAEEGGMAQILAMVSQPGYDPNQLEAQFETLTADNDAPLLNRATQGQYQPGLTLQPFLLAGAVERGLIRWTNPVTNPNRSVPVNGTVVRCTNAPPEEATWADILTGRCPGPMLDVGRTAGGETLTAMMADFGLTQAPALPLPVAPAVSPPITDSAQAAIGQETLTITPLQLGLALAALGNDGETPPPQLVWRVQGWDGAWHPVTPAAGDGADRTAVSPATAQLIRRALPQVAGVREHVAAALSGPDASTNVWYLGLAPADAPRYAVVALVEDTMETAVVAAIGRRLLQSVIGAR